MKPLGWRGQCDALSGLQASDKKTQTFLLRQLVQTFILYTINLARTFSFQNVVEEYQRKCFVLLRFKKVFAFLADTFISQNNRNRDKQHFFCFTEIEQNGGCRRIGKLLLILYHYYLLKFHGSGPNLKGFESE